MGWPLGFSRVRITPRTVNRAQIAYLHIPKSFLSVPLWPSDSGVWTLMRRHGDSRLVFHNPNDLHARKDAAKWAAGQIGSWLPMLPITKIHEESVTQGACGYSEDTGDRHPPCIYIRKKDSPGRLPGMGGL